MGEAWWQKHARKDSSMLWLRGGGGNGSIVVLPWQSGGCMQWSGGGSGSDTIDRCPI